MQIRKGKKIRFIYSDKSWVTGRIVHVKYKPLPKKHTFIPQLVTVKWYDNTSTTSSAQWIMDNCTTPFNLYKHLEEKQNSSS